MPRSAPAAPPGAGRAPAAGGEDGPDAGPRWRLLLDDPADRGRLDALAGVLPAGDLADYLDSLVDALARRASDGAPPAPPPAGPPTSGASAPAPAGATRPRARRPSRSGARGLRLCFRLEPPAPGGPPDGVPGDPEFGAAGDPWTLRFLLQATDDPSLLVPAGHVWRERGETLHRLNRSLRAPQEYLLRGLGQATQAFPPLAECLRGPFPEFCALTTEEAYRFVRDASAALGELGYGVLVPGFGRGA